MREEINKTLEVLRNGGVILYPTDTVWGLGCDATNSDAVARINEIKGRPENKSLIILLDSSAKLASYAENIPEVAYDLVEFAENPLTIVFEKAKNLAPNVINSDGSIGIRIPNHEFCRQLLQRFRKPLVSTSANVSGQPTARFFDEIADEIKQAVDYVVDFERDLQEIKKPSTIMKLGSSGQFTFIRK
jgi:L-threonylcarbamoyladenylate synthase